jgi:hypothetical protein
MSITYYPDFVRKTMERRIVFLGFETYWMEDSSGAVKVRQRTARKKLQGACRRIKEWIKANRHLKGREFIKALNRRLQEHYTITTSPVICNQYGAFIFGRWNVHSNG